MCIYLYPLKGALNTLNVQKLVIIIFFVCFYNLLNQYQQNAKQIAQNHSKYFLVMFTYPFVFILAKVTCTYSIV